jgi:hypothetical protein
MSSWQRRDINQKYPNSESEILRNDEGLIRLDRIKDNGKIITITNMFV